MTQTRTNAKQVGRDSTEKLRESMSTNEFAKRATDAAYTVVGLGVMGAQRATAATKHAAKQFGTDGPGTKLDFDALLERTKDATANVVRGLTKADGIFEGAVARIEVALAPIEEHLPAAARESVQKLGAPARTSTTRSAQRWARSPPRRTRSTTRPPKPRPRRAGRNDHQEQGQRRALGLADDRSRVPR